MSNVGITDTYGLSIAEAMNRATARPVEEMKVVQDLRDDLLSAEHQDRSFKTFLLRLSFKILVWVEYQRLLHGVGYHLKKALGCKKLPLERLKGFREIASVTVIQEQARFIVEREREKYK